MRSMLSVVVLAAWSVVAPASALAQGLSVTNYRLISVEPVSPTQSYYTLAADLVNTGAARNVVTATVSSPLAHLQTVVGRQNLHFSPVPSGSQVPSLDTFRLLVNTQVGATPADYAQLQWSFSAPYANAGPNQTVPAGQTVTLNGSGSSNPAGAGFLLYQWSFVSRPFGSSARIANPFDVLASFVADVVGGTWVVQLTASNSLGTDVAFMTVTTGNSPPVANAGANQTVSQGALVTLNGSASSDVDGDPLTFVWTLPTRPAGSNAVLANPTSVTPTFIADRPGTYTARLVVNDGKGNNSMPANVTITTQNTAPVANAGLAQTVSPGAVVQLSGSASTDVDGNPLTYSWSLITKPAGSVAALNSLTAVNPVFTVDLAGNYVAQLIVNDGQLNSMPATVTISTTGTVAPTANAGPNQTVRHHSLVQLNGNGTDPQGRVLTYLWSLTTKPVGSTAALSSPTNRNPTFTADLVGNYVAQLIVNNGIENSQPSTVTITTTNTAPVANGGTNQTVAVNAVVTLNGSFSSDADGDALTYAWTLTSRPAGSTAALQGATSSTPTFVPDMAGTYVVQLIVSDILAASVPTTVTVTAGSNEISLSPGTLTLLGGPAVMTVTLSSPAGIGGQLINLNSTSPSVVSLPLNVTVPQNSLFTTFTLTPGGTGSATITATGFGFRPGTAIVTVGTPTISLTLANATVGLTKTINGTVTLSAPASVGGVTVNLNVAQFGIVTLGGTPVVIGAGTSTGTFTVTGVTAGSTTISGNAPGYASGSTPVSASLLGQVIIEKNVTVAPGETKPIAVSLASPAPAGGLVITLSSSSVSNVAISNTVTIAAGNTVAAVPATVTGVAFGSATISGTASGFTGDSSLVVVGAALSFAPPSLNMGVGTLQNLILNLSGPAPSNMTVNLSSSDTQVATVPVSVVIAQNTTTVLVPVTSVSAGNAIITATPTLANVTGTTANVSVSNVGGIQMPASTNLNLGQTVSIQVTLSAAAPAGGVTVNLSTSNASRVSLSANSVFIPAGGFAPMAQPTMTGASPGSATLTATANGFGTATQAVTVLASFSLTPPAVSFPSGSTQNLTLILSGPAPAGGVTVNLTSSSSANATVPATVLIPANATSAQVPVAGQVPGSSVITASATGVTSASATVTVQNSGVILVSNVTVSPGQAASLIVTLPAAAATNTTVALSSSDTNKATLSQSTVTILTGQTQASLPPSVIGVGFGSATITGTAAGYGPGTGVATVGAALSFAQQNLTVGAGAAQSISLSLSVVAPAGGVPVTLSSSNGAVLQVPFGTTIVQNSGGVNFQVTGLAPGTTVITATTNVANVTPATITVTVPGVAGNGTIALPAGTTVTVGQSAAFPVTLSTAAGSGGVVVSLSSVDTSKVTISPASVTILAGQTQPANQPQVTGAGVGSANITASAAGFDTATQAVQVNAGGSVTLNPGTLTVVVGATQNLTVGLPIAAGLGGKLVNLSSSDAGLGAVPATVTVAQGAMTAIVPVTGNAAGTVTITATSAGQGSANSTVTVSAAGAINLPANFLVGPGQTKPFPVTLATPAAVATTVTLSSGDESKMTISPQTIFFNAGQTTPTSQASVTGIADATVTVSASGTGLVAAATNVRVGYTLTFTPATLAITGTATQNLTLALSSATPSNLTVTLSSGNTSVATVGASAFFTAGSTTASVAITGVAPGAAIINAVAANITATTATVTVTAPNIISVPALSVVSLGKYVVFSVTLPSAAGANGVTVTLSSSDSTKVIAPSSVFIPPGQTTAQPSLLGENVGDVNVTASAPGYLPGVGLVKVGTTATWQARTLELSPGQSKIAFIQLGASAPGQAPFPGDTGVVLNFSSSNPNVATIREFITAYPDGSEFTIIAVAVNAQAPGTAIISSSGLNIPLDVMTITVGGPLTINTTSLPNGTVGMPYSQTLQGAGGVAPRSWQLTAGTLPAGLGLNSATGVISGTPTVAVAATPLTFRLLDSTAPSAQTLTVQLSLTIVVGSGGGASMTLTPSPLAIAGTGTQNLTLALSVPAPAGGLVVNLNSSSLSVATVGGSAFVLAGASSAIFPVTGVSTGNTTITALANGYGQATAGVTVSGVSAGDIILPQGIVVAPGDFKSFPVVLAAPSPSGTFVALTISDPSKASFSVQNFFINAGQITPTLQPRLNGIADGPIVITASAQGLVSATTNALIGFGLTFTPSNVSITGTANQGVTLSLSSPAVNNLVVTLTSSNPNVATAPPTVTINSGNTTVNVLVTGVTPGTTILTASAAGIPEATATVTVNPPGMINVQPVAMALGTTVALPLSLTSPAPFGGLTVSLVSSHPGRVTVPASVVIPAGQTTPASPVMVTGVNVGPATITATAPAYISGAGVVNVNASVSWLTTNPFISQGTQQILFLKLSASAPWPVDGGVAVTLTSSNPAVAQVQGLVNFFPDGSEFTTVAINVTGLTPGTAVITAEGLNIPAAAVTVNVVGPLAVGTATLPTGSVGLAYSQALAATGGRPPFTWALTNGTLPGGLTLNPATGVISGTPTLPVSATALTFQVSDGSTPAQNASGVITITITAQQPTSVAVNGGGTQTTAVSTLFGNPLSVLVKDANNLPVPGITVTFAVPASGASATFAGGVNTAVTNAAGIATSVAISANTSLGSYTSTASVSGLAAVATFNLTNTAGLPATVTATAGTPQNAPANTQFGTVLTATVRDSGGNPVNGVVVTFVAPGSGATASFAGGVNTATTNGSGVASSVLLTANGTVGSYVVTASAPSAATQASYNLTNTSGVVTSVAVSAGSGQSTASGTNFALPLSATVRDAGNNPVPGILVTFAAPAPGAASATFAGGVTTATTNASGIATSAALTANATDGAYVVTASVANVAAPANFNLTNAPQPATSVIISSGTPQSAIVGTTYSARLVAFVRNAANNPVPGATVTFTLPVAGASGTFAGSLSTAVTNAAGLATSAQLTANAIAGVFQVTATTAGLPPATFTLTNNAVVNNGPQILIPSVQVGKNLQALITLAIPAPAPPGGVRITLTPTDYNLVRVAGRQADAGGTSPLQVVIGEGSTQVTGIYIQGLESSGTAQVIASAVGYTDGIANVDLFPSGLVLSGPNGAAGSFTMFQGGSAQLTVQSARLTAANIFAEIQAVKGGVVLVFDPVTGVFVPGPNTMVDVGLTSSTPSVGNVAPSLVTIVGGLSSATSTFLATSTGASTVTAGAPSGYALPLGGANALAITVVPSGLVASPASVGQNLQVATRFTLNSPAPNAGCFVTNTGTICGLPVTVTSSDASKVRFSPAGTAAAEDLGLATITVVVPAGRSTSQDFYVQGFQSGGTVSYTISGPGFGSANGAVTLSPSGFVLFSPFGRGADFFTTTGAANSELSIVAARLDGGGNFLEAQAIRGGLSVSVPVTSATPAVGTITLSPLTIVGPNNSAITAFDPSTTGTTLLSVTAPSGFTTPSAGASLSAQVRTPQISVTGVTVGKNLQITSTLLLGQPAPAGGVTVTLTSASGSVKLSTSQTVVGTNSISVNVPQGQSSAFFFVQGFADTGVGGFSVSAPGYTPTSGAVTHAPSGIILSSLFGPGAGFTTTLAGGNQPLTVSTALLDASNVFQATQPLAPGANLTVALTNSNPASGTVPATAVILAGTSDTTVSFTPLAGSTQTTLGATQPSGYTQPTQFTSLLARVNP